MNALTLLQPWAYFLSSGIKEYETRSWKTEYRGPLAIHAARRPAIDTLDTLPGFVVSEMLAILPFEGMKELPLGAILGIGELVDCHLIDGDFIGRMSERELALGDFRLGRYAWEFREMEMLDEPIPARGAQRLWEWE